MLKPVDRNLVLALRHIKNEALPIRPQLPTIRIDDIVNAIDLISREERPCADEILSVLHHRRAM